MQPLHVNHSQLRTVGSSFGQAFRDRKQKAIGDSNLSFYINELAKVDPLLRPPLMSVTYGRDITLYPMALEEPMSVYFRNTFGKSGTQTVDGISDYNPQSNTIPSVAIDRQEYITKMRTWALKVQYNEIELRASRRLNQPLDLALVDAVMDSYEMDINKIVYIGRPEIIDQSTTLPITGLLNSNDPAVTTITSANPFNTLTANEILQTFANWYNSIWVATSFNRFPTVTLLSPEMFASLAATPITIGSGGTAALAETYLSFLMDRLITPTGQKMEFRVAPFLTTYSAPNGTGLFTTGRAVAYTDDTRWLRFPCFPVQRFNTSIYDEVYSTPYFANLGSTQLLYPETVGYLDNIGATLLP